MSGGDDGDGDCDHRDDRRAPVAQEDEDHQDDEGDALGEGMQHPVDRGADELALVVKDFRGRSGRQRGLEILEFAADVVGHGKGVGRRLAHDAEPDRVPARLVEFETRIFRADLHAGHLAEADEVAVLARDDDLFELLRGGEARIRLDRELALRGLDASPRQLDVLALDRGLDVLDGEAARSKRRSVDPDAHGKTALAAEIDVGDARQGRQPVDVDAPQIVAELERIERRGRDADPKDRGGVVVDLADHGGFGAVGKPAGDARDRVAHVGSRRFGIAKNLELDRDRGTFVLALRRDLPDALDAGDGAFDDLGDAALDDLVRSAAVDRRDGYDGPVHLGIFAHRHVDERCQAADDQEEADHDSENRASDKEV